jgi:MarR family transcriptional regulator, transcriptional regulator for hemolysin
MTVTLPERTAPDLGFLLTHTSHMLNTRLTAALGEIGMTLRGLCVLLHALPGELTQIELAKLSDLDKTTMVVTMDELEEKGLAERRPSASDRRARIIAVTDEGARVAAAGQQIIDRVNGEVLGSLPPAESAAFTSALYRLVDGYLAEPPAGERPVRRRRQARA